MIRFLSYGLTALMLHIIFISGLQAATVSPHVTLKEKGFEDTRVEKYSIWDRAAVFVADELAQKKAGVRISELSVPSKIVEVKSQGRESEWNMKFKTLRAIAASA